MLVEQCNLFGEGIDFGFARGVAENRHTYAWPLRQNSLVGEVSPMIDGLMATVDKNSVGSVGDLLFDIESATLPVDGFAGLAEFRAGAFDGCNEMPCQMRFPCSRFQQQWRP